MHQELKHSFSVGTTCDRAWSFLWNIKAVAQCIPGCEEVLAQERVACYRARLRRHVGPFLIRFDLDILVERSIPPHYIQVTVSGEDKRLRSQLQQSVNISLKEVEDGRCEIELVSSFELSGMLTSLGERLLRAQIQRELDLFASCVQSNLDRESASVAR